MFWIAGGAAAGKKAGRGRREATLEEGFRPADSFHFRQAAPSYSIPT
jgi:hypothetical protein